MQVALVVPLLSIWLPQALVRIRTTTKTKGNASHSAPVTGRLGIVDFDEVDSSNLQRQVAHDESRVGVNKAESLAITIQRQDDTSRILIECHLNVAGLCHA